MTSSRDSQKKRHRIEGSRSERPSDFGVLNGNETQEVYEVARENAIMAEIGRIVSSSLDIDEVYNRFAEQVSKLIPFDGITITLLDVEKNLCVNPYVFGYKAKGRMPGQDYRLSGTVNEYIWRIQRGLIYDFSDTEEILQRFPGLRPVLESSPLKSFMSVPR